MLGERRAAAVLREGWRSALLPGSTGSNPGQGAQQMGLGARATPSREPTVDGGIEALDPHVRVRFLTGGVPDRLVNEE
jgi:hypothetical protein